MFSTFRFHIHENIFLFQNSSLTWYTEDPQFTRCFEKTVLVSIPCIFLWVFSPIEIYYLHTSKNRNIPWNWLNKMKLETTGMLIVLLFGEVFLAFKTSLGYEIIYPVNFYPPIMTSIAVVSNKN